jgi:hypothetical protein
LDKTVRSNSSLSPPRFNTNQKDKLFLNLKNTKDKGINAEIVTDRFNYCINDYYKINNDDKNVNT